MYMEIIALQMNPLIYKGTYRKYIGGILYLEGGPKDGRPGN
jgi:hypothetical protein